LMLKRPVEPDDRAEGVEVQTEEGEPE